MKTILVIFAVFIGIYYIVKTEDLEGENYIVIQNIDNIEIREYKQLIYASYTPKNTNDRNNSFRNVAGYIFGDNEKNQKINMTSPVVIKMHNKNEMAFIMPEKLTLNTLPEPKNKDIDIYLEPSNIKACITYSGYSNNMIEKRKIKELKKQLSKHKIEHNNDFEVLIYNSPYDFINRKNEIVVSIQYYRKQNILEESIVL